MKPRILLLFACWFAGCGREVFVNVAEYKTREKNLVNPAPVALDEQLRTLARTYRASSAAKRVLMRASLSEDELYTLFTFARRAAVFGMRERDRRWVEDGLGAVAMIDLSRMDSRDSPPIELLYHAAARAGVDAKPMFAEAATLAPPRVAEMLREFPDAGADRKALGWWGLEELPTGFIERGGEPYSPTRDLKSAIIDIAAVIDADRYPVSSISIARELPDAWIAGSEPLLRNARGSALIDTELTKGLTVWLIEVPDAATAEALRDGAAKEKATPSNAVVGIARGNLFCLIVANVLMHGDRIDETPQTLQRFVAPIERILDRTGTIAS